MATYKDAVYWIAQNDSNGDDTRLDPEIVGELVTSCLVADLFNKSMMQVGRDVVRKRKQVDALNPDDGEGGRA